MYALRRQIYYNVGISLIILHFFLKRNWEYCKDFIFHKTRVLDGPQMLPNVLKAILDHRDFLSSFSIVTTSVTLQPLLTYLAIPMSSILPFLFPVRKTGCIAPILQIHKANLLFKSNHYYVLFFPLKFPEFPSWNIS